MITYDEKINLTHGILEGMRELIAYEEFANMNKTADEPFKVKKGVKLGVVSDPGLQRVEKRLAEKISEINLSFEEELKTIEED
jgi:hypothetical protein